MDLRDVMGVSARARTLTQIAAYGLVRPTITIDGQAIRMEGSASVGMFPMLGVQPEIGRNFTAEEGTAGRDHVLILAHDAWRRFGGDSGMLGRVVSFSGEPTNPMLRGVALNVAYTVTGVMPRGFWFPYDNAQFWVPRVFREACDRRSRIQPIAADDVSGEPARELSTGRTAGVR